MTKKQLVENKIRQIVKKTINEANDDGYDLQQQLKSMPINADLASTINGATRWDYKKIALLTKLMLEDANFDKEAAQVYKFMLNI